VRFSLYSEIHSWPGKSVERLYAEVLEQIEHADRLGYYAYRVIEHYFFPEFSVSANPLAFFAAAAQRTKQIRFGTLLHPLPLHNPTVLASQIAAADILLDGRYEFGVGRGHAWLPPKAGVPLDESKPRYEEALEILFKALENERFTHEGRFWSIEDSHIVPRPARRFRVFLGGTSDTTYELAGTRGWGMVVPPLLPYHVLEQQLDLYRRTCAEHGHEPDIVWIHACYLDEDGDVARREAERGIRNFMVGQSIAAPELRPKEELVAAGYGFYAAGILEHVGTIPYDDLIAGDYVWVGTPDEVAERIQGVIDICPGVTEVSILVNMGGIEHWKAIKAQELFADRVAPRFA
jgi:alkanesulfonate monooxygenase SsuD/methylene tetrahydromethanopterin reductase-like flavin-dependent oxidoreductase (luciferase family)